MQNLHLSNHRTINVLEFPHQVVETAWLQRNTSNLIYEGPVILLSCSYILQNNKDIVRSTIKPKSGQNWRATVNCC